MVLPIVEEDSIIGEEPHTNAVWMESVAALGQQEELLVVSKFAETQHTLDDYFGLCLEALHKIIVEHQKAFNGSPIEIKVVHVLPPSLCISPSHPSYQAFISSAHTWCQ